MESTRENHWHDGVFSIKSEKHLGTPDVIFATGLYTLSTGKLPDPRNITLLCRFVDFSLRQTSAGYDDVADNMASQLNTVGLSISKVYWPDNVKNQYRNFLDDLQVRYGSNNVDELNIVLDAIKCWFKSFHYWEIRSRDLVATSNLEPSIYPHIDQDTSNISSYRDSTNYAYAQVVLTILDPHQCTDNKHRELLDNIYWPTLMLFQIANDFGQYGLPCQLSKPTMDKLSKRQYDEASSLSRIALLAHDALEIARPYLDHIDARGSGLKAEILKKSVLGLNVCYFVYNVIRYQLIKDTKGRFEEKIGDGLKI